MLSPVAATEKVLVGIKQGDWIEYDVTTEGSMEQGHDVTWARMEILRIVGYEIHVNVTTKAFNGSFSSDVEVLNPAESRVGFWYIVPAELNNGDIFFDASTNRNVTIEG